MTSSGIKYVDRGDAEDLLLAEEEAAASEEDTDELMEDEADSDGSGATEE